MSAAGAALQGFVYGEHLDSQSQRSLGFRLLAPVDAEPWCQEVEALARRLQATPYPDHWPPSELFCSVLLADGRRLVACAHYGLADHTPSRRRGGLELVGVIGPSSLGVTSALAVYQWLRQRRSEAADPRALGGRHLLTDVLSAVPHVPPRADPVPVLPIRLWQDGALLFAATVPSDPNHHLALLEQGASGNWQWLPLVGPDFPLQSFAQRGPLIAWTPHLAGVAVKLDPPATEKPRSSGARQPILIGSLLLLLIMGAANLWATLTRPRSVPLEGRQATGSVPASEPVAQGDKTGDASGERFARALFHLMQKEGGGSEWSTAEAGKHYERLAGGDKDLRLVGPDGQVIPEAKEVVVALGVLTRRSTGQPEEQIRKALKGYDPRLIQLACQRVHEHLTSINSDSR
jgi:hypothetical protein